MTAGRRDQLVTIQGSVAEQDPYGEEVLTWADLGQEWAAVFYGRGDERRQAAMEQGQLPAIFAVLDNETTRAAGLKDRIVFDGANWDILANVPSPRVKGERELTAVRAV